MTDHWSCYWFCVHQNVLYLLKILLNQACNVYQILACVHLLLELICCILSFTREPFVICHHHDMFTTCYIVRVLNPSLGISIMIASYIVRVFKIFNG